MPSTLPFEKPAEAPPRLGSRTKRQGWGFLEFFALSQVVLPAVLYFPGTQAMRVPIRMAPFMLSLAPLAWQLARQRRIPNDHPAQGWLILAALYLFLMIAHPTTNTVLAGVAQVFLYLAVMAPVFWAPGLVRDPAQVPRILALLFVWSSLNSVVGLLQVYYPDRWLPQEYSRIVVESVAGLESLTYLGPNGQRLMRPPGLSDNPGYVCVAGTFTGLFGLIYATAPLPLLVKGLCLALAFIGTLVIYLTQVRTSLLILAGMLMVYGGRFLLTRWRTRGLLSIGLGSAIIAGCFLAAVHVGGESAMGRFSQLWADDPLTTYNKAHRGVQMKTTLTETLLDYPLGAGLGRWGMMHVYFGDSTSIESPTLWAELQVPAWVLDGGFVLLFLYSMALIVTAFHEWAIVRRSPDLSFRFWAAGVMAMNIGTLAFCFGYTPFTSQMGVQYWFFVGLLHGAAGLTRRQEHANLSSG